MIGATSASSVSLSLILAALVGATLGVERRAVAQLMLSRPLVAGPLAAGVLGEPLLGLALGIALELFFLSTAFHGTSTPDHDTWGTVLGATIAAGAMDAATAPAASLAIGTAIALPIAPLGRVVERQLDRSNQRLPELSLQDLNSAHPARASNRALSGLVLPAGIGAGISVCGVLVGQGIGRLGAPLNPTLLSGLELGWWLFTGLCAARAIRAIQDTRRGAMLLALAVFTLVLAISIAAEAV